MYNYGSPRVGNNVFAKAYDAAVPNTWRVINTKDVIPRVPRLMGYCHVGRCISLKEDGTFQIDGAHIATLPCHGHDVRIHPPYVSALLTYPPSLRIHPP
jgi:hypothetical protein